MTQQISNKIAKWWQALMAHRREKVHRAAWLAIDKEARQRITLLHYDKHAFIAFDGVPLIKYEDANIAVRELDDIRDNFRGWRLMAARK